MMYSFYLSPIYSTTLERSEKMKLYMESYIIMKYTFLYHGDLHLANAIDENNAKCKALESAYFNEQYLFKAQLFEKIDQKMFELFMKARQYKKKIKEIIELKTQLGIHHETGLYGSLRKSIHGVEKEFAQYNDNLRLMNSMLMLRRHEKDFMLRGLREYIDSFDDEYNRLIEYIENEKLGDKKELKYNLQRYYKEFHQFARLYTQLYGKNALVDETQMLENEFMHLYNDFVYYLEEERYPVVLMMKYSTLFILTLLGLFLALSILLRKEIELARDVNPLTHLNGNKSIEKHLELFLPMPKERMVIYFDFDNFKPFNDYFGYKKGDEVILQFAQLLIEYFSKKGFFIGHIGGDDFIVMSQDVEFEKIIEQIKMLQKEFVYYTQRFYSDEAQQTGKFTLKDRFGIARSVDLLGVSVVALILPKERIAEDTQELSNTIASLKKSSKITKLSVASLL